MPDVSRDEQLDAIATAVTEFVDKRVGRLRQERAFLQSILDSAAGAAAARSQLSDEVAAIESVRALIGLE